MSKAAWRLLQPVLLLHIVIVAGIVGYMLIEDYDLLEAIYMTTISVTTVGYGEVKPLSEAGRLFTSILLITSWVVFAFALTRITQYIVGGEINKYLKNWRVMHAIDRMSGHVIICGFGRNGQQAALTMKYHGVKYVVIEREQDLIVKAQVKQPELLYLLGDGTDDEMLRKAHIDRARALITTLPDDADNVFIVLSARSLNPDIRIISRASNNSSYPKLIKAGADHVIMPDKIGGTHMATLISKPDVVEFMDYLSGEEGESIHIESIAYEQLPQKIRDLELEAIISWRKTGVSCIGLKRTDGKFIINPSGNVKIEPGMKIMVLGSKHQIEEMRENLED